VPRSLGQAGSFLLGLWMALVVLQPIGTAASQSTTTEGELAALESALQTSINDIRGQYGLLRLVRDPALDGVARAHARDMATRGYLAHETPEGLTPPDRLKRGGVTGVSLAGENVGTTSRLDPNREIVTAWMQSPVHHDNIVAPAFNETGIGIARAADGSLYYTQLYVTKPR
jgi:uncharacterized protein YkwD